MAKNKKDNTVSDVETIEELTPQEFTITKEVEQIVTENPNEEIIDIVEEEKAEPSTELDNDFAAFEKSISEHSFTNNEEQHEEEEEEEGGSSSAQNNVTANNFKVMLFMNLLFLVLDGVHAYLYKFISKMDIDRKDMELDEDDKESLESYFQSEKVVNIINKMPMALIGVMQMEYLYFMKYQDIVNDKKAQEAQEQQNKKAQRSKMADKILDYLNGKIEKGENPRQLVYKLKIALASVEDGEIILGEVEEALYEFEEEETLERIFDFMDAA